MTATDRRLRGLHRRRAAVHPEPGRAVQARERQGRQHVRHRRHGDRPRRDHRAGHAQHLRRRASALLAVAVVIGAAIGLWRARQVEMTGMPELIAILHSFVGLAAVLVGWNGYLSGIGRRVR